jgi:hypothetical protein
MNLLPFIVVWSLSLAGAGDALSSSPYADGMVAPTKAVDSAPAIGRRGNHSIPGVPATGSLGSSFEEEDDSLEDGFVADGWIACEGSDYSSAGNRCLRASARLALLRLPSPLHPLRC